MAGKNTSANGLHESRKGGIVAPFKLSEQEEKYLSAALGRKLSSIQDIEVIESALATYKNLRDLHFEGIAKRQDIKRTLTYISKCQPDKALIALSNCDEFTKAEIDNSLWFDCGLREMENATNRLLRPPANLIAEAAKHALGRFDLSQSQGGAPTKGYQIMFAGCCINLWRHLGGEPMSLWRKDGSDELSPLLTWSVSLFSILEGTPFDWKKAWTLISAELKRGKVSTL